MAYSRVLVICPANALTAGPEALHQLVDELVGLGVNASIVYHPFDRRASVPEPYRKYRAPVGDYVDASGDLIVFPEIFPTLAMRVRNAQAAIWWMSVNNYTCVRYESRLRDNIRYLRNLLKGRRPWRGISALKGLKHLAQSHYAEAFLADHGIVSSPLSDPIPVYLEPDYLSALDRQTGGERQNVILYNPTKGAKITARLMHAYPDWSFQPLRGLDRNALAQKFLEAKLYIDFGHHPGKDRLPREAALHGCCVVTCRYGSAADPVDVPIPDRYKLDPRDGDFVPSFGREVARIFGEFGSCAEDFEPYRHVIRREASVFRSQVASIFTAA